MQTIKETRKYQYKYHSEKFPYLNDWKRNPYSFLKARFYMEASAILVHLLLKTKVKPNTVTIIYGLAGIVGGILLSIPLKVTIILALFIFFTKGILDWSDGHLARITGQTSLTGHILDIYGAHLNSLGLQIGLGFYVAQKAELMVFYYLIPLIPFFCAASLSNFARIICMEPDIIKGEMLKHTTAAAHDALTESDEKLTRIEKSWFRHFVANFLDDRARSVDFICLLILIEVYTGLFITWLIVLVFLAKRFIVFCGSFFVVVKHQWAEVELHNTLSEIYRYIKVAKSHE